MTTSPKGGYSSYIYMKVYSGSNQTTTIFLLKPYRFIILTYILELTQKSSQSLEKILNKFEKISLFYEKILNKLWEKNFCPEKN
jgi:hypothetical protein